MTRWVIKMSHFFVRCFSDTPEFHQARIGKGSECSGDLCNRRMFFKLMEIIKFSEAPWIRRSQISDHCRSR